MILGILNFIIYTADTAAKLKGNEKGHACCQLCGCFVFSLSLGHLIWIAVLRFRRSGRIVSGDYLTDGERDQNEFRENYLIAHGKFAKVYLILTAIIFGVMCLGACCCGVYMACVMNKGSSSAEKRLDRESEKSQT